MVISSVTTSDQSDLYPIFYSKSTRYLELKLLGEGCFGKVIRSLNLKTAETVAIKIHKSCEDHVIEEEVAMLEKLKALDPEKKNIVRFVENFMSKNVSCLAFEMLDRSLWTLMEERRTPLTLNEIRPITQQLLVAFEALKGMGIIHTDLKPDNIMLVNHQDQPFRVKLIDFGLAIPASKARAGMMFQAAAYRAPDVTLGLPISEAIDMWGLGCVIAFLYFGTHLFNGICNYYMIKAFCHLLGQPDDQVLSAGQNTWQYFSKREGSTNPGWRLKTPKAYKQATGVKPKLSYWPFDSVDDLQEAVHSHVDEQRNNEYKDKAAYLQLLQGLLCMDPKKRVTPKEALKYPFIAMTHFEDETEVVNSSSYAEAAFELMSVCPLDDSDKSDYSLSDSEADIETSDSSNRSRSISTSDENSHRPAKIPRTDFSRQPCVATDSKVKILALLNSPPNPDQRRGLRQRSSSSDEIETDPRTYTVSI